MMNLSGRTSRVSRFLTRQGQTGCAYVVLLEQTIQIDDKYSLPGIIEPIKEIPMPVLNLIPPESDPLHLLSSTSDISDGFCVNWVCVTRWCRMLRCVGLLMCHILLLPRSNHFR